MLIRQNFEAVKGDEVPTGKQPVGTIGKTEANADGPLGRVTVAKVEATSRPTRAARIDNVPHRQDRAPSLQLRWADPPSGVVRVEYRFMTPVEGPFLSPHFFGGDWKSGAAVFLVADEKLMIQFGENDARFVVGVYRPNTWYAVRLDFDVRDRTFGVYIDGRKRANRLPWQAASKGVGRADLFADFRGTAHAGAPVLFVDDITVQTIAAAR